MKLALLASILGSAAAFAPASQGGKLLQSMLKDYDLFSKID